MATTRNTPSNKTTRAISIKDFTQLRKELDELKTSVDEQGETLHKIHQAIVGDKDFGHDGLVALVRKHERWIESQKFMWAKIYGGMIVISGLIGLLLKFVFN